MLSANAQAVGCKRVVIGQLCQGVSVRLLVPFLFGNVE
jgi:hypothetical protein